MEYDVPPPRIPPSNPFQLSIPLSRGPLPRFYIDSTNAATDLCFLGFDASTDKSPFNMHGHRHPYTPVYTMLFAHLRHKPIQFAEIGIAAGASAEMWERYFDNSGARFHFFDRDQQFLDHLEVRVGSDRVKTGLMDVGVVGDIARALKGVAGNGQLYDVIIDDSSHNLEHQLLIIKEALPLLRPGGILIVEDIFRDADEKRYTEALESELEACSFAYFVMCESAWKWSPGWDNDKLLVLVKA